MQDAAGSAQDEDDEQVIAQVEGVAQGGGGPLSQGEADADAAHRVQVEHLHEAVEDGDGGS